MKETRSTSYTQLPVGGGFSGVELRCYFASTRRTAVWRAFSGVELRLAHRLQVCVPLVKRRDALPRVLDVQKHVPPGNGKLEQGVFHGLAGARPSIFFADATTLSQRSHKSGWALLWPTVSRWRQQRETVGQSSAHPD